MRRGRFYTRLISGSRAVSTSRLVMFFSGICLLSISALLIFPSSLLLHSDVPTRSDVPRWSPSSAQRWFTSWRWLNPFSSNIADSKERSALPPLERRCEVYTFYEKKGGEEGEAEGRMLLAWRRAFWAQGFKPLVLGMAEAREHGLYRSVKGNKNFKPELEAELMKWLAWARAGTGGVLVDYRIIPMAPRDDYVLSSLRHCDTTYVTRYERWGHRLFYADKASIESLLKHMVTALHATPVASIEEASEGADEGLVRIELIPRSFADYTPAMVAERYPDLKPADLPLLVNAHLHESFLRTYHAKITAITLPAPEFFPINNPPTILAKRLSHCPPDNPLPASCPSNAQQCPPCKQAKVSSEPSMGVQVQGKFIVAAVPHPYTYIALTHPTFNFAADRSRSIRFMLEASRQRDSWLRNVTTPPANSLVGPAPRVLALKSMVAEPASANSSSLWMTAESPLAEEDLAWELGFTLPTVEQLKLEVGGVGGNGVAVYEAAVKEVNRWKKGSGNTRLGRAIEAWNFGSAEAWKFTSAFAERAVQERKQWGG